MDSSSSEQRTCCKFLKVTKHRLPFYAGHLILVTIVTLPAVFYVSLPGHSAHSYLTNKTISTGYLNLSELTRANLSAQDDFHLRCNSPLIPDNETGQCRPPCAWTTQSPGTQVVYYVVIVVGIWLALFSSIFTIITWASITSLRKFPHVVRFHIIICCVCLAFAKMVPLRHGLEKTFCLKEFWEPTGQTSFTTVIQGAASQYFTLAHSCWAMCFVANTYAVIVREKRTVFNHPVRTHLIQSILCWLGPAIIMASSVFFKPPGYKFLFADLLGAGPATMEMAYFTMTLPVQVTLGISLCLLWCIVWHLRKARLDSTKRVIRAREERVSMRRVERQFMSMAILMLLIVGVVLSIQTVIMYRVRGNVHDAEMYFRCLQVSKNCEPPRFKTLFPLVSVVAPGFLCIIFFFLLFMNKDCRKIWKGCFGKSFAIVSNICQPVRKVRAETDRSRCSSTLTVLCDRKGSELSALNVDDPLSKRTKTSNSPNRDSLRVSVMRASTFSLPFHARQSIVLDQGVPFHHRTRRLEGKLRCNSVPIFLPTETEVRTFSVLETELTERLKATEDHG